MKEIRLEFNYDFIRFTVVVTAECCYIDVSSDVYDDAQIDDMMGELEPIIASIVNNIKFMVEHDLDVRLGKEREIICGKD